MANYFPDTVGNGQIIWLFGRPCAGKTTISNRLAESLKADGTPVITLDGDELRATINRDLGFSLEDRYENIRRACELARIFSLKNYHVVCSFVTPTIELRDLVLTINKDAKLSLIYIKASVEECIRRDVKGHYREARNRTISDFTGISSPFEEPEEFNSHIVETDNITVMEAVEKCLLIVKRQMVRHGENVWKPE
ncbi:MAG: adenylyl-sulfate kinase [Prolixibacteraceae bacterium]|nr:adenylyl-sulfate kinase [Prolixibacteraceae bacterium]